MPVNSGPIPGANFTSDTKNYPWHKPPEFTDISASLDMLVPKLMNKKVARSTAALAETGIPLYRIAGMVVMQGISEGKWTVDMALLLVGPVCKILEIICTQYSVEYNLGLEEDESFVTGTFFKAKAGMTNPKVLKELPAIKAEAENQEPAQETVPEETSGFAKVMEGK